MAAIDDLLNQIYDLDQINGDHAAAVAVVQAACEDADMATTVDAKRVELEQIVSSRSIGGVCGCSVSKAVLSVLIDAQ